MTEINQYVFTIEDGSDERIDSFLAGKINGLSRSHIQKLIVDAHVLVNERSVKASYKVQQDDRIEVIVPKPQALEILAQAIALDVLYEDSAVIVINKARGMVVHPAVGNYSGTLVNALLAHCQDLSGINGQLRPGIVHRLDKDTSGVMVAAKSDEAHISLAQQIKERSASRNYIAIVHGNLKTEQGVIDAPIGRHPTDRKKMAVVASGKGKAAVTHYQVLEHLGAYTVVTCKLMTGRTHQIRVHMSYCGHPVVGDPTYSALRSKFAIVGQALHSQQLQFVHPVTKQQMTFTAPLPPDMEAILTQLRRIN